MCCTFPPAPRCPRNPQAPGTPAPPRSVPRAPPAPRPPYIAPAARPVPTATARARTIRKPVYTVRKTARFQFRSTHTANTPKSRRPAAPAAAPRPAQFSSRAFSGAGPAVCKRQRAHIPYPAYRRSPAGQTAQAAQLPAGPRAAPATAPVQALSAPAVRRQAVLPPAPAPVQAAPGRQCGKPRSAPWPGSAAGQAAFAPQTPAPRRPHARSRPAGRGPL